MWEAETTTPPWDFDLLINGEQEQQHLPTTAYSTVAINGKNTVVAPVVVVVVASMVASVAPSQCSDS